MQTVRSEYQKTNLLLVDSDPLCGGEPFVVLNVIDSVLEVAISLGKVHLEQENKLQECSNNNFNPCLDIRETKTDNRKVSGQNVFVAIRGLIMG